MKLISTRLLIILLAAALVYGEDLRIGVVVEKQGEIGKSTVPGRAIKPLGLFEPLVRSDIILLARGSQLQFYLVSSEELYTVGGPTSMSFSRDGKLLTTPPTTIKVEQIKLSRGLAHVNARSAREVSIDSGSDTFKLALPQWMPVEPHSSAVAVFVEDLTQQPPKRKPLAVPFKQEGREWWATFKVSEFCSGHEYQIRFGDPKSRVDYTVKYFLDSEILAIRKWEAKAPSPKNDILLYEAYKRLKFWQRASGQLDSLKNRWGIDIRQEKLNLERLQGVP